MKTKELNVTSDKWNGKLFTVGGTVSCDRCKKQIVDKYGWNVNCMVCEKCLAPLPA